MRLAYWTIGFSILSIPLLGGCRGGENGTAPGRPAETAQHAADSEKGAEPEKASGPEKIATKTGVEMVRLPGGKFIMGDDQGEDDERPAHEVELSPFYIDVTEVTQASFKDLMGRSPAKFQGADRPVERLSWHAAMQYCNMRSQREGLKPCYDPKTQACDFAADGYRLPTEAEWEYACRAGAKGGWSFGGSAADLDKRAWFKQNAAKTTHPVKQKQPNAWGLYDMHGNVAEWCNDFYAETYPAGPAKDPHGPPEGEERVLRGGSWNASAEACRAAARKPETPGLADVCFGYEAYGFRCVRRAEAGSAGLPKAPAAP